MFYNDKGLLAQSENFGDEHISLESMQMINESLINSFLTEDEQYALLESHRETNELVEAEVVTEKTLVRLDKNARINQVQKMSVFTIAKEKNDPLFKKLLTVWRIEKNLENKLFKKYGTEGLRRAKKTVQQNYRQKGQAFVKINDRSAKAISRAVSGKGKQSTLK